MSTTIARVRAAIAVAVVWVFVGVGASLAAPPRAGADPVADTDGGDHPVVSLPVARPMPADPARINPIGGARVSSTTPQGETAGTEAPLAAQTERGEATVAMWAKDGIFVPTTHPNKQLVIHLPGETTLAAAAWTGGGGGIYGSPAVDYQLSPVTGGGLDITITRKTVFSSSTIAFGVKLPAGTHLRQGNNVVLVETDTTPGRPAAIIATFSIPAAHDNNGTPLSVTPTLGPGFPPGQTNLTIDLGPADIFAFPITIAMAYRASDTAATGAPTPNWEGLPEHTPTPTTTSPDTTTTGTAVAGGCPGGINTYASPDGRTADFTTACATHTACLATTPQHTSITACHNRLLAHLSLACTTTYGQTGEQYQACTRGAETIVTTAKTTMGGPGE